MNTLTNIHQEITIKRSKIMQLRYYPETDSLYIELIEKSAVDSQEITNDVVVDFDENGDIVGIDIDHASKKLNLNSLETINLPNLMINQLEKVAL